MLFCFVWADDIPCITLPLTKYHKLGGLFNTNIASHSSEGSTSEIKVLARSHTPLWAGREGSFRGWQVALFSLSPSTASPFCAKCPFLQGHQVIWN